MRLTLSLLLCALLCLVGCSPAPKPIAKAAPDVTTEAWYGTATAELAGLARRAEEQYRAGHADAASVLIERGEVTATRLLAVPRPTLAANEAASDLDDLYGRMLFGNRHYGWARLQFQKNVARWKRWQPKTADTEKRLAAAQAEIDKCDARM